MKKRASFLITISVVCVVFLLAWETASRTAVAAPVDIDDGLPIEGGDALNDLMRSLVEMRTFNQSLYGLEGNFEIVGEISGSLEEGGAVSRIRLVALRHEGGAFDRQLILEIMPPEEAGESPFIIALPGDVRGFRSSIAMKNFMSREKSEILLTVAGGRRGDRFLIVAVAGRQGNVIFDSYTTNIPSVVGRFMNNYRAEIIVRDTGERALIDLSSRMEEYHGRFVYNRGGSLRRGVPVWVERYSLFEPTDVDHDGIFEIKKVLDLSGAGRADRIAYVEATLKFERGRWNVIDSWIAPAEDLRKLPLPIRIN